MLRTSSRAGMEQDEVKIIEILLPLCHVAVLWNSNISSERDLKDLVQEAPSYRFIRQ